MKTVLLIALFALLCVGYVYPIQFSKSALVFPTKHTSPAAGLPCKLCVSFMSNAIQELIEIIANVGIVGGCSAVCSLLPTQLEQVACDLLCDVLGIEEFVKLIDAVDPDPIYICKMLKSCPINDNGNVHIDSFTITPAAGRVHSTFTFSCAYSVLNTTGTGELLVEVQPPGAPPFGDGELLESKKPGKYSFKLTLKAEPSEEEPFIPGTYHALFAVCENECGSKHPHSKIYDEAKAQFQITP